MLDAAGLRIGRDVLNENANDIHGAIRDRKAMLIQIKNDKAARLTGGFNTCFSIAAIPPSAMSIQNHTSVAVQKSALLLLRIFHADF
jgi:hypothetical protein